MFDFDLFVIGAGSGGVRAARMAASLGAKVAIAEERYMGGTCVNVGCIPKKLYSFAAHYRYDFADSAGYGWDSGEPAFNWPRLRDNKKTEIGRLNGIYENLLGKSGITIYHQRATIGNANTVLLNGQSKTARYILIATGGWPFVPDFPGHDLVSTSNEIFDLPQFPARIMIVGGGYIGMEFAGIFAGLGADTLVSYRADMPLRGFDEDIRRHFAKEAGKHVCLLPGTQVEAVNRSNPALAVSMRDGSRHEVDAVLYATGRKPNTRDLGLEAAGVALEKDGSIQVNDTYQTTVASIYALGDVVGRKALTPVALAEGMVLASHLFGDKSRQLSYDNIATAVFSHPNLATVGLTESEASGRYGQLRIYESDFLPLRHTMTKRDERSYMKVIVDAASDRVVGMHMMGQDCAEIMQGFAAAMTCGLTKAQLDMTIGIHPTAAEEFVTLRTLSRTVPA